MLAFFLSHVYLPWIYLYFFITNIANTYLFHVLGALLNAFGAIVLGAPVGIR